MRRIWRMRDRSFVDHSSEHSRKLKMSWRGAELLYEIPLGILG